MMTLDEGRTNAISVGERFGMPGGSEEIQTMSSREAEQDKALDTGKGCDTELEPTWHSCLTQ